MVHSTLNQNDDLTKLVCDLNKPNAPHVGDRIISYAAFISETKY